MFNNIKMKLLIGGKSRNIYMRKDGSAYYKSGGQQVDVTYMFKKNGGGLKKQYIGGVEGNLAEVEKNKRSNKCAKQILGGVVTNIKFDPINIDSKLIMDGNTYQPDTAQEQLKKICCLALYGLGAAMAGELATEPLEDEIKVIIGTDLNRFVKHLSKFITDHGVIKSAIDSVESKQKADEKLTEFRTNMINKQEFKDTIKRLGINDIPPDIDFKGENCVTVTRAYILNKILQCFLGANADGSGAFIADNTSKDNDPVSLLLNGKKNIINPSTGVLNNEGAEAADLISLNELNAIFKNILETSILQDQDVENPVKNLNTVLFLQEQIGAPSAQ
jgi:hypothetical protein